MCVSVCVGVTHTHTHTRTERERETEREGGGEREKEKRQRGMVLYRYTLRGLRRYSTGKEHTMSAPSTNAHMFMQPQPKETFRSA